MKVNLLTFESPNFIEIYTDKTPRPLTSAMAFLMVFLTLLRVAWELSVMVTISRGACRRPEKSRKRL